MARIMRLLSPPLGSILTVRGEEPPDRHADRIAGLA
jgi:hypothetical protein